MPRIQEQIVDVPVPRIMKEIGVDVLLLRIMQDNVVDVLPGVMKEIVVDMHVSEEIREDRMDLPSSGRTLPKRIYKCTGAHLDDEPVFRVVKEIVEVVRLFLHEDIQHRTAEEIVMPEERGEQVTTVINPPNNQT